MSYCRYTHAHVHACALAMSGLQEQEAGITNRVEWVEIFRDQNTMYMITPITKTKIEMHNV